MRRWLPLLLVSAVFAATLLFMRDAAPLFAAAFPGTHPPVYDRGSFVSLAVHHLALVGGALAAAGLLGIGSAILVTRQAGLAFRPMVQVIATIGQTFPPAAVLAMLVPVLGFGDRPIFLALSLYGLLPITENALAGLQGVPASVREAANGMGLSPWQRLRSVEIPLAMPLILTGLRTAAVVGLGTATIGSTVGALTLGTPIIDGLVSNKPGFVLQGAVPLALLAVMLEMFFNRLEGGQTR